jgi:dephospho-CoA kinase
MRVIGLVGGVASGKSLVARQFAELGAGVLDGDRAGHEVLRQPEVEETARRRWGPEIFTAEGRIDRKALARIVFAPTPDARHELSFLEQLTHPHIGDLLRCQAAEMAAHGVPLAILDAPVLFKAGWHQFCDKIVFVEAPEEIRRARARERGWSDADFAAREAAQESLNVKQERADTTVDNSGSPEATQAQVERLWHSLIE